MTRRFPHLIVTSVRLAKHDEEGGTPSSSRLLCSSSLKHETVGVCLPTPITPLPRSKHEWPCLPTPTLRLAFQAMEGSVMATPLLSLKRESEASSANTCPLTRVSSNGGLVHAHHHPPCCILQPSTPSLAQNVSRRAVLLPPTLCPTFRATGGFVHAHQALRHLKHELEGPFFQPPPSDSSFK